MRALHRQVAPVTRRIISRTLHTSTTWYAEETAAVKKRGARTKKSVADLPRARTLADGTLAAPLGNWNGGLISKVVATVKPAAAKVVAEEADQGVAAEDDVPKPKRTRRKKEKSPADEVPPEVKAMLESMEASTSPKPRRRRKAAADTDVDTSVDAEPVPRSTGLLSGDVLGNLARFPHCILLTRVGQFYESYFDQAPLVASLLNIKSTSRPWAKGRIPMAGFPLSHLDRHLRTLVQTHGRCVALCEEFPRPDGSFERRVARIVTPGTLIDEPFVDAHTNNYLLAVTRQDADELGLAWIDVSTGEFFAKSSSLAGLRDELARLAPKEVVLELELGDQPEHPLRTMLAEEGAFVAFLAPTAAEQQLAVPVLHDELGTDSDDLTDDSKGTASLVDAHSPAFSLAESSAIALLTSFLSSHLLENMPHLGLPRRDAGQQRMRIDASTLAALELTTRGGAGSADGSLLSAVRRTVTAGGARLLARWLAAPSTHAPEIAARHALVGLFRARPHLRADLRAAARGAPDAPRLLQRLAARRGGPPDLASLHAALGTWAALRTRIALERDMEAREKDGVRDPDWDALDALVGRMAPLEELGRKIDMALQRTTLTVEAVAEAESVVDELGGTADSGVEDTFAVGSPARWSINPDFSPTLTSLHAQLQELLARRVALEQELQTTYCAPSLTLRSARSHGMLVHIGRSKRDAALLKDSPAFAKISESGTTCAFFHQPWSVLGAAIVDVSNAILGAERDAFESLRAEVATHAAPLRRNARVVDELDVTVGFADIAAEMGWARPELSEEPEYHVVNGRHPTVELGLLSAGRGFTPNTVSFAAGSSLHVITGPNMAGKSTLLRQTALIALLAQAGAFVPADAARVGIADALFARVGARDDVVRDRSTFMVEMLETAAILRGATRRSLVIVDEVGRGTTVRDGLALAFAALVHLLRVNGCRTLFATHFHELADMLGAAPDGCTVDAAFCGVQFFCTDVQETQDGFFSYSHRLRPGINRDSHGIKVAQLANMPPAAIATANAVIAQLGGTSSTTSSESWRELGRSALASIPELQHSNALPA